MKKITLTAIIALSIVTMAGAQNPVLKADSVFVCPPYPTSVVVGITTYGFSNISSFSFSMGWNPAVLQNATYAANPQLSTGYLVANVIGDTIHVAWFSITPLSLPDGSTLLSFSFNYLGGSTPLGFSPASPFFINGAVIGNACSSVTATLVYDNSQQSPITNTVVGLYQGTTLVSQGVTNLAGQFSFSSLYPGTYKIIPVCIKPHGGLNAIDPLLILKHFVQAALLQGIRLKAADVNQSGGIPGSADALAVLKRAVGQINSFYPPNVAPPGGPDWYYEDIPVNLGLAASSAITIKMLCAGDVNGSHIP